VKYLGMDMRLLITRGVVAVKLMLRGIEPFKFRLPLRSILVSLGPITVSLTERLMCARTTFGRGGNSLCSHGV
jgi:hypothetical protein